MAAHPAEPYEDEIKRESPLSAAAGAPWMWLIPIVAIATLLLGFRSCQMEPGAGVGGSAATTPASLAAPGDLASRAVDTTAGSRPRPGTAP